ncbi:hypothetical protein [Mycoplasma sp. E35C]|uniref:hypothetical protein n=1 Tax=Mycoplasma sp. E35C TaxID=2801918 RepID=UPI001CA3C8A4|nr:hypothetical protein [Mycoplasma sp. E35C]QZX49139.1 hypothetical protein JJE79_03755 [Mycoplasma sp. E35C]
MFACSFDFNAWKSWEYQRKYSALDFVFNLVSLFAFFFFACFHLILRKPDGSPNNDFDSPIFWIGLIMALLFAGVIISNYVFGVLNLSKVNKEYIKTKRIDIENSKKLRFFFNFIQYGWPIFFIFIHYSKRYKEIYLNMLIWSVIRSEDWYMTQIEEKYIVRNDYKKKYLEMKAQKRRTEDIINNVRNELKKLGKIPEIDKVRVYKLEQKTNKNINALAPVVKKTTKITKTKSEQDYFDSDKPKKGYKHKPWVNLMKKKQSTNEF